MAIDFNNICLGKRPVDPARVSKVPPHILAAGAPPPASLPRTNIVWTPSLVANDRYPTCTIAGLINSARMWALLHGFDLVNTDSAMLAFYAFLAGCADTDAAISASDGLELLDVLDHARGSGFDAGQQVPLVPLFRSIDIASDAALKDSVYSTGTAYIGVTLYEADVQPGAVWTGDTSNAGKPVGGHCITSYAYDATTYQIATWGETMEADEAWLQSRMDEAYSLSWTFPVTAP
jgi:hypothetical protein